MSAYSGVQKGSLKLKNVSDVAIKKKKSKKSKEKELQKRMMENVTSMKANDKPDEDERQSVDVDSRTSAEIAFERAKEKRTLDDMMKKPIKTHKERIMEFNEHLDNLSEHYDIPKVSWTK
jgi:protein FAM32A